MLGQKLRLMWRLMRVGVHLLSACLQIVIFFKHSSAAAQQARIQRWSLQLLNICGMGINVQGHPCEHEHGKGQLLVANHISWLDIYAINALMPVRFVAKDDIQTWPVIGWLVTQVNTVFIPRGQRHATAAINRTIAQALEQGGCIAIFPEGTTTDGTVTQPFKSSLFQAAITAEVSVQPIAIRYPGADGCCNFAPAYHGDTTLWQSLCAVLQQAHSEVSVSFLPVIATDQLSRQKLSALAQAHIDANLAQNRSTQLMDGETVSV